MAQESGEKLNNRMKITYFLSKCKCLGKDLDKDRCHTAILKKYCYYNQALGKILVANGESLNNSQSYLDKRVVFQYFCLHLYCKL